VRHYKYRAVITLDDSAPGVQPRPYPSGTHSVMIRCSHRGQADLCRYFPAAIYRYDGQPLTPGETGVVVTLDIADDEASAYFGPGQRVSLWQGRDIGHGVISRLVLFASAP
jgi:hypothetical protein